MSISAKIKATDDLWFDVSADSEPELFKSIARVQEVFSVKKCGKCGCKEVKFVVRAAKKKSKWLEVCCQDLSCRAKLVYSTTEDGNLIYPKKTWNMLSEAQQKQRHAEKGYADKHGGFLPNDGWFVYQKGQEDE